WQWHAHAPVSVEGREPAVRRRRLCRLVADGAVLCRGIDQARASALRPDCADHEFLQTAGAWLLSAGQPGLPATQPFGGLPDSDVLGIAQGQARRIPPARPEL